MKRLLLISLLLFACMQIMPAAVFDVTRFGALGNGSDLDTKAIQAAIDKCHSAGGGRVYVPAGTYIVGTLNLKSNVEFYLENGAVLKATTDLSQYQRHNAELAGIFYTEKSDNVSIIGNGCIDGNGMSFMEPGKEKVIGDYEKKFTRQGLEFRKVTGEHGDGPLYPKDRYHQMIVFSECTDITLSDFKCKDSPYWCFVIVHCEGVKIHGLYIDNDLLIPNGDGIDVISCSDVTISDCRIYAGDDAIVLAGYGWHHGDPGFKNIRKPSRNIKVDNCILQSRSSGIRIGGNDLNSMSDYSFSNISIFDSNRGINISVSDSSSLENMTFNNIHIETRLHTGDWWGQGEPIKISAMVLLPDRQEIGVIRNLFFNNITCTGENSIIMIADKQTQLQNIYFNNFEFILRKSAIEDVAGGNYDLRLNAYPDKSLYATDIPAVYIENAANVYFNQGNIGWKGADKPYHTYAIDAVDVDGLRISNTTACPSPAHPELPALRTRDCTGVHDGILR
ncbi:MAG: right-handed parallel beta-helix repeat-containing protein [Bacteroidetes bacterium]|uniref:Right-handed parallel beta-helix repeat-containing protein n=1 Tax=Candidatus Cryptobacteroides avicola TaxID=2840757 RepID=A0A940DTQ2_9BACT|nr:right-handed parallel beta-helix repeat-containing protein [Candidatus Cryptobacteroides avicola]